jgi:hypothetical protein
MSQLFTIAIGSDHAGFTYKEAIKAMLLGEGHTVRDFGTYSDASCDYPDFIRPTAEAVARGEYQRGIVLGGSGNGEAIVANRVRGVRCGLCWNEQLAVTWPGSKRSTGSELSRYDARRNATGGGPNSAKNSVDLSTSATARSQQWTFRYRER